MTVFRVDRDEVSARLDQEISRLEYLRVQRASVRQDEIDLMRRQFRAAVETLRKVQPRLDAVRVMVEV